MSTHDQFVFGDTVAQAVVGGAVAVWLANTAKRKFHHLMALLRDVHMTYVMEARRTRF